MCSINPPLVEKGAAVHYRDVTTALNGVNNIRLRGYRVHIWYSDLIKRADVHDNSSFPNIVHLFPNDEAWVAKGCGLSRLFKATLLIKLVELRVNYLAVSRPK